MDGTLEVVGAACPRYGQAKKPLQKEGFLFVRPSRSGRSATCMQILRELFPPEAVSFFARGLFLVLGPVAVVILGNVVAAFLARQRSRRREK